MPEKGRIPVLLLFGPTASGKTEILERLFAAPGGVCPAEVISADSMQVYRGMDIGTAKPSPELRSRLPHHLIDIRNPDEQFNAGEFVRLADEAARDIYRRGALPVVSGGTGFYLTNLVLGLPETPLADPEIRRTLKEELASRGIAPLAAELAAHDPLSYSRIHGNDEYRILRALEVWRLTGRPLSSYRRPGQDAPSSEAVPGADFRGEYRFLLIGLDRQRPEVYRRINERCGEMFRAGLPAEVRSLYDAGYGPADPGMRAIGYREFFVPSTDGDYRLAVDLAAVETLVARNSRHYAKRQITYFASLPNVRWISATDNPVGRIRGELEGFLKGEPGF